MGSTTIGIIGSGQMGGGIALVGAVAKHNVVVYDKANEALTKCRADHAKRLAREVEKGRMTQADVDAAIGRLKYVHHVDGLKDAEVVIEAIVEDARVKAELFAMLAKMFTGNQILATNTSSISITEIAAAATAHKGAGERVIGMHFFNPVPVMKLVEVIKGLQTSAGRPSG
jgi:3-hydroxybutyryl-CoA dehydrogenase